MTFLKDSIHIHLSDYDYLAEKILTINPVMFAQAVLNPKVG